VPLVSVLVEVLDGTDGAAVFHVAVAFEELRKVRDSLEASNVGTLVIKITPMVIPFRTVHRAQSVSVRRRAEYLKAKRWLGISGTHE
jgi:hypothetical protein